MPDSGCIGGIRRYRRQDVRTRGISVHASGCTVHAAGCTGGRMYKRHQRRMYMRQDVHEAGCTGGRMYMRHDDIRQNLQEA